MAGFEPAASCSQSRRDNRATLHPVTFSLTSQTKFQIFNKYAEGQGLEPWHRLPDDSLANCSITTLAPLQAQRNVSRFAVANLRELHVSHKHFDDYF